MKYDGGDWLLNAVADGWAIIDELILEVCTTGVRIVIIWGLIYDLIAVVIVVKFHGDMVPLSVMN